MKIEKRKHNQGENKRVKDIRMKYVCCPSNRVYTPHPYKNVLSLVSVDTYAVKPNGKVFKRSPWSQTVCLTPNSWVIMIDLK